MAKSNLYEYHLIDVDKIMETAKGLISREWVSSLELENYTSQHESVSEAAEVGIPDEKWGERPLVLVEAQAK